jgi:hypothetical protein
MHYGLLLVSLFAFCSILALFKCTSFFTPAASIKNMFNWLCMESGDLVIGGGWRWSHVTPSPSCYITLNWFCKWKLKAKQRQLIHFA